MSSTSMVTTLMITAALVLLCKAESLSPHYYRESCPMAEGIVRESVERAVYRDPRMAASLLRLYFHDCFVMGCDGSILLDSEGDVVSEKQAGPNLDSLRGFEIIDRIKSFLEEECPLTVSCADILAIAARDAVYLRGGPGWEVSLGRRDSLKASFSGANQHIPSPNSTLRALLSNFETKGLDAGDLVALSGSHTFGRSRCLSFRARIQEDDESEERRSNEFRRMLQSVCPESGERDNALVPLDFRTSTRFDNHYFLNLLEGKGLLQSDESLFSYYGGHDDDDQEALLSVRRLVWAYAEDQELFFRDFARSMAKMGSIGVLTGDQGDVRRNCRYLN